MLTEGRAVQFDAQRVRERKFNPLFIPKHERCFASFDDKVVVERAREIMARE